MQNRKNRYVSYTYGPSPTVCLGLILRWCRVRLPGGPPVSSMAVVDAFECMDIDVVGLSSSSAATMTMCACTQVWTTAHPSNSGGITSPSTAGAPSSHRVGEIPGAGHLFRPDLAYSLGVRRQHLGATGKHRRCARLHAARLPWDQESRPKCLDKAALNASGCSTFGRCPAFGMTSNSEAAQR